LRFFWGSSQKRQSGHCEKKDESGDLQHPELLTSDGNPQKALKLLAHPEGVVPGFCEKTGLRKMLPGVAFRAGNQARISILAI
jgi:hypothetical protein